MRINMKSSVKSSIFLKSDKFQNKIKIITLTNISIVCTIYSRLLIMR